MSQTIKRPPSPVSQIVRMQNWEFFRNELIVRDTSYSVRERSPNLKPDVGLGEIAISPVGRGEHDIPKWKVMMLGCVSDLGQVFPENGIESSATGFSND